MVEALFLKLERVLEIELVASCGFLQVSNNELRNHHSELESDIHTTCFVTAWSQMTDVLLLMGQQA